VLTALVILTITSVYISASDRFATVRDKVSGHFKTLLLPGTKTSKLAR